MDTKKKTTNPLLQNQFMRFEKLSGGKLGIAALHLESNNLIDFNGSESFLMCSTKKIWRGSSRSQHTLCDGTFA